jgi:DtxR family Mn-dependent transcriptional regulator
MSEDLSSSLEDYLEMIYVLTLESGAARAKDIAERLGVRRSSVTGALRMLSEKALVHYTPYGLVTLTAAGRERAGEVRLRHEILREFFVGVLQVDAALAEEAACQMEHGVPRPLLDRLIAYLTVVESCPNARMAWDARLGFLCRRECAGEEGARCPQHDLQCGTCGAAAPPEFSTES